MSSIIVWNSHICLDYWSKALSVHLMPYTSCHAIDNEELTASKKKDEVGNSTFGSCTSSSLDHELWNSIPKPFQLSTSFFLWGIPLRTTLMCPSVSCYQFWLITFLQCTLGWFIMEVQAVVVVIQLLPSVSVPVHGIWAQLCCPAIDLVDSFFHWSTSYAFGKWHFTCVISIWKKH